MRSADPRRERPGPVREPLPTRFQEVPDLPPDALALLDWGLGALGIALEPAARTAIEGHLRLLLAWTVAVNLTAIRDPQAAVRLHLLDSLAAVPLIRGLGADRLLDLGSGGGYPGLPLAAALPASALLVDSTTKKVRFLDVAIAASGLETSVTTRAARAETLAHDPGQRGLWPLVTARAVAPLPDLVELALPLLAVGGWLVAWKRGPIDDELAAGSRAARELGGERPERHAIPVAGLDGHVLVTVRKRRPTPASFPREPGLRTRRPW